MLHVAYDFGSSLTKKVAMQLGSDATISTGIVETVSLEELAGCCGYTGRRQATAAPYWDEITATAAGIAFLLGDCNGGRLIVNIGSGTSFIFVSADGSVRRVGGSALGGGTFRGLAAALACTSSMSALLQLAGSGDFSLVDSVVGDSLGAELGLDASLPASFFGLPPVGGIDLVAARCASLLRAVCFNTAQLAFLYACLYGASQVVVTGTLVAELQVQRLLSAGYRLWASDGSLLFAGKEGYVGALGVIALVRRNAQLAAASWK